MNERVKQLLVLGREHYAKRELDKAEQMLRMVLEEEDRYADVHDMLGVIAHSRGNLLVAERHFERALELNPAYTEAALNLAVTYNDRGKYEKARDVYSKIKVGPVGTAQGLDPFARGKLANMHADLAQAYADAGLPRECGLGFAGGGARFELGNRGRTQRLLPAGVGAPLLGHSNTLPLPLPDQRPLERGKRAHHGEQQGRHGRILAGEGELFFDELDRDVTPGELLHDLP